MRDLAAIAGQDGLPEDWLRRLEMLPRVAAVERRDFEHVHRVDRETLVALVGTWSVTASSRRRSVRRCGAGCGSCGTDIPTSVGLRVLRCRTARRPTACASSDVLGSAGSVLRIDRSAGAVAWPAGGVA
jgi:hypothetical protein